MTTLFVCLCTCLCIDSTPSSRMTWVCISSIAMRSSRCSPSLALATNTCKQTRCEFVAFTHVYCDALYLMSAQRHRWDHACAYVHLYGLRSCCQSVCSTERMFVLKHALCICVLQPWRVCKDDLARAGSVIALCTNVIYLLGLIVEPFMPDTSAKILEQLNLPKRSLCSYCLRCIAVNTLELSVPCTGSWFLIVCIVSMYSSVYLCVHGCTLCEHL
jgi:hypothetical protein